MAILELIISPDQTWKLAKGFLALPREIRDVIYTMVLVELPRWERRHSPLCHACPRDLTTFERPVFDSLDWDCRCMARHNLGLLRVSRQIHREAALIFWSRNTFCFSTVDTWETVVRRDYLHLIERVNVFRCTWQRYQIWWLPPMERDYLNPVSRKLWPFLSDLKGLKYLELGPECIPIRPEEQDDSDKEIACDPTQSLAMLKAKLPSLEEFSLATHLVYDLNQKTTSIDPGTVLFWDPPYKNRDLLFVAVKKPIDLDKITNAEEAKEAVRTFSKNFVVHVMFAFETGFLGVPENDFSSEPDGPNTDVKLASGLNDQNRFLELTLRDKTTTTVQVLGLPLSKQTRLYHVKQRRWEDIRRKAAGEPTLWEEKTRSLLDALQRSRELSQRASLATEYKKDEEAKVAKRKAAEDREQRERRKAAAKKKRAQQEQQARSERQAKATRLAERKRVRYPK